MKIMTLRTPQILITGMPLKKKILRLPKRLPLLLPNIIGGIGLPRTRGQLSQMPVGLGCPGWLCNELHMLHMLHKLHMLHMLHKLHKLHMLHMLHMLHKLHKGKIYLLSLKVLLSVILSTSEKPRKKTSSAEYLSI